MLKWTIRGFFLNVLPMKIRIKNINLARTKVRAERVHAAMHRVDIQSVVMHGDKDQKIATSIEYVQTR